jgi:predicted transcriptional regulator
VAENQDEADKMAAYEATLKPMTKQELLSEIREGMADYHRGDYVTLDDLDKEAEAC